MPTKNKCPCTCSCGCKKVPGCRRIVCSSCGEYVCPGYCIAIDELDMPFNSGASKFSLCRQCLKHGTMLQNGKDRIICDGQPGWPTEETPIEHTATLQDSLIAYVIYKYIQTYMLVYGDAEQLQQDVEASDDWQIL